MEQFRAFVLGYQRIAYLQGGRKIDDAFEAGTGITVTCADDILGCGSSVNE
jgi:hypothetical protein